MSLNFRTFQSAGQISSHIIPGAYSRIDSVKGAAGLASANNGVVMGKSTGGQPTTLLQFNSIAEAVATLKGGDLMEAVRLAFNPGGGLSPQRVFAIRVNDATQASTSFVDGSSNDMIDITSLDYGLYTNQIKVTLAAGTNSGKKITIEYQSDPAEVFDDVERPSFTIQNTGGAATMTIVNNSGANTLVTTGTPALNIDLNDYSTVGELVAFMNNETNITATVISGQENASPLELDAGTFADINASPVTAYSSMQAIIDAINAGSGRVSAVASNAANDRVVPENFATAYLSGGTEGAYTSTEWTAALTALEAEDVQFVSTPDSDSSVHSAIKAHCESMSAVSGRKERQFLVGAPYKTGTYASESATAIAAAVALNSKNGMYVFNGGSQYDVNGSLRNYGGSFAACMLMGAKCALAINQPLTFKELGFIELEWKLSDSQMENLLKNGVACVNYNSSGVPHLVRQFNTYQTNDLKYNEFSVVTEMFFASRDLRNALEQQFIGQPGTTVTGGVLRGAVEARLALYESLGIFIKNPNENRSWWNVQVNINGDAVYIDYDAYITLPVNFTFVTNHFHELVASV
jgi:hypothetical protein